MFQPHRLLIEPMPLHINAHLEEVIVSVARGTYILDLDAETAALLQSPPRQEPGSARNMLAITFPSNTVTESDSETELDIESNLSSAKDTSMLYETAFIEEEEGNVDDDDDDNTINHGTDDPNLSSLFDDDEDQESEAYPQALEEARVSCTLCQRSAKKQACLTIHHGRMHEGIPFQTRRFKTSSKLLCSKLLTFSFSKISRTFSCFFP